MTDKNHAKVKSIKRVDRNAGERDNDNIQPIRNV
jgi:hypothetical protein